MPLINACNRLKLYFIDKAFNDGNKSRSFFVRLFFQVNSLEKSPEKLAALIVTRKTLEISTICLRFTRFHGRMESKKNLIFLKVERMEIKENV